MAQQNISNPTQDEQDWGPATSPFSTPRAIKGIRSYGQDDQDSLAELFAQGLVQRSSISDPFSRNVLPRETVTGEVLLDDEGYLIRGKYYEDLDTAEMQMLKFSPKELATIAKQLQRTGFYGSADPSGLILNGRGYTQTDASAFVNLLRFSNQRGLIVQSIVKMLSSMSAIFTGDGTKVKVTADDDIKYYLEQAFYSKLGRAPRKTEIDMAIKAIQDNERKASAASKQQPSVAVASQVQAEKMNPGERSAYQLGNAIKLAFQTLAGGI